MSKHFAAAIWALPLILQIFNNCFGQDAELKVTVRSISPPTAEIRGRYVQSSANRNFSLLNEYAGFSGLADRVSDIRLEDEDGKPVAFKQFIPGEYVAVSEFREWSYKIDLTPPKRGAAAGHVSWMGAENGLLFLDDLLPLSLSKQCVTKKISLQVPDGWTAFGNDAAAVSCTDKTVYFLSKRFRRPNLDDRVRADLTISGDWKFSDQQAADFVDEILSAYARLFGGAPTGLKHVYILPFPIAVRPENWEADTRGNSVTILSSDMPFPTQSVQRLHEQLRHELFHLWLPNGIHLKGSYDWFYEGFALYESLKLGVDSNRLRFGDFLDTLGRAMTIDAAFPDRMSLIDASRSRTNGGDTFLYARGMLIGFLTDMRLLVRSNGKRDVEDVLRAIYQKYQDPENEADGNAAVLAAIADADIKRYVETGGPIMWASELSHFGIEKVDQTGLSILRVRTDLSGAQRKLLDKLGYNNWRKSSVGPR